MRFEKYINESRSKTINSEEAVLGLIKNNCSDILKKYRTNNQLIYRGIDNYNKFLYVDPTKGNPRTSVGNIPNYYTLLMDNLPSWKDYPKRSRSLICSINKNSAHKFGKNIYIVFPYNGAKIGVCPSTDIWFSFRNNISYTTDTFVRNLQKMFIIGLNIEYDVTKINNNWNLFKSLCNQLSEVIIHNPKIRQTFLEMFMKENIFIKTLYDNKYNIFKSLEILFDPNKNNFKLTNTSSITTFNKSTVELWVGEKPSILLQYDFNDLVYTTNLLKKLEINF